MAAIEKLLTVDEVTVAYGTARVLEGVNLDIGSNETFALLGANGAGKSTLLRTISGLVRKRSGRITFSGTDITKDSPGRIAKVGLSHVLEGHRIVPSLSVRQNLILGSYFLKPKKKGAMEAGIGRVCDLFPQLERMMDRRGGLLSGGQQQMLAIAQALISEPRLLLLDEPTAGLAPSVVESLVDGLRGLREYGLSILLVEQNVTVALSLASRVSVLRNGAMVMEGVASESCDPAMIARACV
jgi:branched-chain amino acid transport system ATP-binding protein